MAVKTKKRKSTGKKLADNKGGISNGERLIAYCGLYCGDCPGYKGTIANLARDLRKELEAGASSRTWRRSSADIPFFKALRAFRSAAQVLKTLPKLQLQEDLPGQRRAAGLRDSHVQSRQGFDGCWQCGTFKTCTKLDFLRGRPRRRPPPQPEQDQRDGAAAFLQGKRYWRTDAVCPNLTTLAPL